MKIARFRTAVVSLLLISIGAAPAFGQTVTRFVSINPYGLFLEGNAKKEFGYNSSVGAQGVILGNPDGGLGSLRFGFTVPERYAPGTQMVLRVLWRSDAVSCVVDLRNSNLYRNPGGGGVTDSGGLSRQTTVLAPNDPLQTEVTLFDLNGLGDIQSGDAIIGGLFRSSSLDSCDDDFHILGLSILYEALTNSVFLDRFEEAP